MEITVVAYLFTPQVLSTREMSVNMMLGRYHEGHTDRVPPFMDLGIERGSREQNFAMQIPDWNSDMC
jgi:hypothetical protein